MSSSRSLHVVSLFPQPDRSQFPKFSDEDIERLFEEQLRLELESFTNVKSIERCKEQTQQDMAAINKYEALKNTWKSVLMAEIDKERAKINNGEKGNSHALKLLTFVRSSDHRLTIKMELCILHMVMGYHSYYPPRVWTNFFFQEGRMADIPLFVTCRMADIQGFERGRMADIRRQKSGG